jgi:hypothetical protein
MGIGTVTPSSGTTSPTTSYPLFPLSMSVSLRYLQLFTKVAIADTATIHLKQDNPLMLEYRMLDGESLVRFYVAPKVDDGDE